MEQIRAQSNCLQRWGNFCDVSQSFCREPGVGSWFHFGAVYELAAQAVVTHLQTSVTLGLCLCSQFVEFCLGFLFFFYFLKIIFFSFLFFLVCRINEHLFTSRNKGPGHSWLLLSLCYHSFICINLAGGPGAKIGSTWFCDFTIEIKKSNMTEEACCLWNYRFQWRPSLPNHN